MKPPAKPITILLADDDADDCFLTRQALEKVHLASHLHCVGDGEELLDYLLHRGHYANPKVAPRPGVILLDLNMPKKHGHHALQEIKAHPDLRRIPVVVLTTSRAEEDIVRTYDLGANSYIAKPVTFDGLVNVMKGLFKYWFEIVELPPHERTD